MDNQKSYKFREYLDKFKIPIALGLVGLVLIVGGIFTSNLNKLKDPSTSSGQDFPKESIVESQKIISVDVSGAVVNPGVYKLKEGDRVEEALASSGGFSEQANKEYISKYLNLAQKLSDGMKIYIPFEGESAPAGIQSTVAGTKAQTKVNINTAAQLELEALPDIGPSRASKIISDRPYQKIEDLLDKKIVGKSVFEKIKDSIIVY